MLGAMQGPAELLPISSSGHLVLVPALLGWRYSILDGGLRKSFEIALHAGTAAALALTVRWWGRTGGGGSSRPRGGRRELAHAALTLAPPAAAGLLLERPIEDRLGAPTGVAAGQVAGGVALLAADRRPAFRGGESAGAVDALLIGLGQAMALWPGVSRSGAAITAARLRHFSRPAAAALSRRAMLPVLSAATALKAVRLARTGVPPELAPPFAAGASAAFLSTSVSSRLVTPLIDRARSYTPLAVYRIAVGALAAVRLRTHHG